MIPFSIVCTTCQSRLKVHNESALGQILQCPKCGSMVAVPESLGEEAEPVSAAQTGTENQAAPQSRPLSDSNSETVDNYDSSEIKQPLDRHLQPQDTQSDSSQQAWEGAAPQAVSPVETSVSQPVLPTADWSSAGSQRLRRRVLFGSLISVSLIALVGITWIVVQATNNRKKTASSTTNQGGNKQLDQSDQQTGNDPNDKPSKQPAEDSDKQPQRQTTENLSPVPDPAPEPQPNDPGPKPEPPDNPPGLVAKPTPSPDEQLSDAELSELLQEFSPLLTTTVFDSPLRNEPGPANPALVRKLPRPPLKRVNMTAGLDFAIAEFTHSDPIPLHSFLNQVSAISTIPIEVDFDALTSKQISLDLPVALEQRQTTVRQLLRTVLHPHGLGLVEADQSLTIGYLATEARSLQKVVYPVADLISAARPAPEEADLVQWIQSLIAPGTWDLAKTGYQVNLQKTDLHVHHVPAVQFQVFRFLTRLRMARQLDLPEDKRTTVISLIPRSRQAQTILAEPVSFNVTRNRPLCDVLSDLGEKLAVKFVFNGRTLRQAGWSHRTEVTLLTENETLQQSLDVLLTPMDLTTRVINADTVEITSVADEVDRREIEFYPLKHRLHENRSAEQLIHLIQQKLGAQRFSQEHANQAILFDPVSKYLMIRESHSTHRKLSFLLSAG